MKSFKIFHKEMESLTEENDAFEKAIQNWVRHGNREEEGRELLAKEIKHFTPENLPIALIYHGFATTKTAQKMAKELTSKEAGK